LSRRGFVVLGPAREKTIVPDLAWGLWSFWGRLESEALKDEWLQSDVGAGSDG